MKWLRRKGRTDRDQGAHAAPKAKRTPVDVSTMKDGGDVEGLIGALDHDDSETRREAAAALGELRDARAVEPLIALVRKKPDVNTRGAAIKALGELGDPRAVEPLIEAFHPLAQIVGNMVGLAREQPQPPDLPDMLIGAAMAGETAIVTAEALAKMADPRVASAFAQVLENESLREAAEGLGGLRGSGGGPAELFTATLMSQAGRLREISMRALKTIGGPEAQRPAAGHPEPQQPLTEVVTEETKRAYLLLLWDREPWTEQEQQEIARRESAEVGARASVLKTLQVQGPMPTGPDTYVVATALLACKEAGIPFDSSRDQIAYKAGQKGPGMALGVVTIVVHAEAPERQEPAVPEQAPSASGSSGGVRVGEGAEMGALLMSQQAPCRRCGSVIVFQEGGLLAMDAGIQDQVVMCSQCRSVYEVQIGPRGMELLADVTSRYKTGS